MRQALSLAAAPRAQDEKSARDKIIVGLICFAVGLPFTLVLEELFSQRCVRPHRAPRALTPANSNVVRDPWRLSPAATSPSSWKRS